MNTPQLIQRLKASWKHSSKRKKSLLFSGAIFFSLISGWFTLHLIYFSYNAIFNPSSEDPEPPRLVLYLNITRESIYSNGTVFFSVVCIVESYGNYPIPQDDLFQIEKAFICVNDDLLAFNSSFGDIKNASEISVITGDLNLAAGEEVFLKFQTSFDFQNLTNMYVGVIANGPIGVMDRWDRYTTIFFL